MIEFILYVKDQEISSDFYSRLLRKTPVLNVPGMTEFLLTDNCRLGLMPYSSIVQVLKDKTPNPSTGDGIPRCEIYLYVDDLEYEYKHALECNAGLISETEERSWGDRVCYFSDPDGHIIAFASKSN
jgi:lactoylglutathione lyase